MPAESKNAAAHRPPRQRSVVPLIGHLKLIILTIYILLDLVREIKTTYRDFYPSLKAGGGFGMLSGLCPNSRTMGNALWNW